MDFRALARIGLLSPPARQAEARARDLAVVFGQSLFAPFAPLMSYMKP